MKRARSIVVLAGVVAAVVSLTPTARADDLRAPSKPQAIMGGEVVEPGEYPEVVAIEGGPYLCSGTIVSEDTIITAAHCLAKLAPSTPLVVKHGDNIDESDINPVIEQGFHPDFNPTKGAQDIYDIAFVRTQQPLSGRAVEPITTQDEWDDVMQYDSVVTLVGYGEAPDEESSDEESSDNTLGRGIKRKVDVPIKRFSPEGLEFTAGGGGKDSCFGDSGGPAFFRLSDGTLRLAGITSRGSKPCGDGGVYAAPYPGLCWMRDASGLDLTNGCGGCDCLDTTPPPLPKDGCSCRSGRDGPGWLAAVLVLLGLGLRRRRVGPAA